MKKPIVFSLMRDQSVFMTVIMSLLTFLAMLALGISLSIGTGIARWRAQWDRFATVQIMSTDNAAAAVKTIEQNRDKFESVRELNTPEMQDMLRPWLSGGADLTKYLPKMYEIKFRDPADMASIGADISKNARFLTHASALKTSMGAATRLAWISGLMLALILGTIGLCITHIARNTAQLHRRELEILTQIGARDAFVARQMQMIVARISLTAALIGSAAAAPILALILATAHGARVGLMAMMGLGGGARAALVAMPIVIVIFAIWATRRTTFALLKNDAA
ncbi:hypothetical protein HDR63_03860 [bacterium]|nr:hypothetical protein [bacterium]